MWPGMGGGMPGCVHTRGGRGGGRRTIEQLSELGPLTTPLIDSFPLISSGSVNIPTPLTDASDNPPQSTGLTQ